MELAVERVGREDGLREIPATDATAYSTKEKEVIAKIEDDLKILHHDCNAEMQAFQTRLTESYNFQSRINRIQQIAGEVAPKIKQRSNIYRDHMNEYSGVLVKAEEALKTFQRQNHREGPPHAHKSLVLSVGFLLFLFLLEAGINSVFFASGSDFGLVGGIASSLILGLFNTILAFFLGLGSRYINRVEWYHKALGLSLMIFYVVITLFVNFLVGHYRDLSENMQIENPTDQLMSLLGWQIISFQGLTSFNSLLLIGAGLMFSLFCFMDGFFFFSDPYPGYSRIYKRREHAARDFIECKNNAYEETESLAQSAMKEINDLLSEIEKSRLYYQQVIISRSNWITQFVEHQEYLEKVANDLLGAYRQENRQTRKTPPPSYFTEIFKLKRIPNPENIHEMLSDDELKAYISDATQMAHQYSQLINQSHNEAIKEFKNVEDLTPF